MDLTQKLIELLNQYIEENKKIKEQYNQKRTNQTLYEEILIALKEKDIKETKIFIPILLNTIYGNNIYVDEFYKILLQTNNREDIKKFIDSHFSEEQVLYDSLKNNITTIYKWQTDYGYSAYFLLAVIKVEGITSSELDNFLDEMNDKAESWNSEKYTKVIEIAEYYYEEKDIAEEWAHAIENTMKGLSEQS